LHGNFLYKSLETLLRIVDVEPRQEHSRGSTKFPVQNLRQIGLGVDEL